LVQASRGSARRTRSGSAIASLEPGWRGRQKVAPLTLVFWRRGLDWDISYGMESTPSSRSVSLGWKLLVLLLLAAGVVLGMISAKQTDTHAEIELLNIANLCSNVALMAVGVYWIVVKKLTGLGINFVAPGFSRNLAGSTNTESHQSLLLTRSWQQTPE
jgi:hypothetical protein